MSKVRADISGSHEPGLASRPGPPGFDPGRTTMALQAFEDAYDAYWGWPTQKPINPNHPIQQATLAGIRAAMAVLQESA